MNYIIIVHRLAGYILGIRAALALLVGCLVLFGGASTALAAEPSDDSISVLSSQVVSEFPEGMRFSVQIEAENEIKEISVNIRAGQQMRESYQYMEFEPGEIVDAELFWRTNSGSRYIPPGTIITYRFLIRDTADNVLDTEPAEFIYYDARFEWVEIEDGPVSIAYHGPVQTRAQIILDATSETLSFMGPLLGADVTTPIRVTMYNNVKEMLDALPPGSSTIRRELITEGQAFVDHGTLLVLGGSRSANGTASHEVTHILTHRAGDSARARVPSWLDEGLAEYGNVDPGFSYDIALEFALGTGRLLPITSMPALPGDPEDVIIFYGQASSIVRYMSAVYGQDKMRELMAALKSGMSVDAAILDVYGISRIDLENEWRDALGAPRYEPPSLDTMKPTPIPRVTLSMFSLTPQAGTETVGDVNSTPTPEPTAAPTPEPTPTPAPPTPPPAPTATAAPTPTPEPPAPSDDDAGCGAPVIASMRLSDMSMPLALIGFTGFILFRRRG